MFDKVVSNASPVISLCKIRKLEMLKKVSRAALLPQAVYDEVVKEERHREEIEYFHSHAELFVIKNPQAILPLQGLGSGERAAISLAKEQRALLLIDDSGARKIAALYGVKCMGTAGLLVTVLIQGHISHHEFKELLDKLVQSRFRISIELYNAILRRAETMRKR